ncbi:orotidine-5'-phosphate decarboxylase [Candidatus Gracilibacteria bacterium]|nr:orotidine-5'-phosphate decarboxylase [Candidatus Gracilibacteria bacterium]
MTERNFWEMIQKRYSNKKYLCIGLDFDHEKLPTRELQNLNPFDAIYEFNSQVIESSKEFAACFKLNFWYYSAYGIEGFRGLATTIEYIKNNTKDIPIILDVKFNDIQKTVRNIHKFAYLTEFETDAITANPYLSLIDLEPLYTDPNKMVFILIKTSNQDSHKFQNLITDQGLVYERIAEQIQILNKENVGGVFGATYPEELKSFRLSYPNMKILIPGVGSQGASVVDTIEYAKHNFIINIGSSIIYPKSNSPNYPFYISCQAYNYNEQIKSGLS